MKNSIDSFKSRLDQVEETINKPQNRSFEIIQPEEQKQKKKRTGRERQGINKTSIKGTIYALLESQKKTGKGEQKIYLKK